ncbi:PhoPQ-activated protein PqaA family protein [Endozoicomonas sp.]|uniref:PhoPQ-activated protein PqaA family protein n=1 Tax=Endozoicomonas sp. TaxID=1892382 RepID=UPI00383A2B6B
MKTIIRWFITCTLALSAIAISAGNPLRDTPSQCSHNWLIDHMEHILPCYLLKEEPDSGWTIARNSLKTVHHDGRSTGVSIIHADLTSLRWQPEKKVPVDFALWQHRLTIYHPENLKFDTALLYINGGIIHPTSQLEKIPPEPDLDFARIAARTQSIVIDLKDVPNQFLQFKNTLPLKEDNLVAHTWKLFLDNPRKNYHWPLQLPMVKAAIASMNASEEILQQRKVTISGFVLAGGSKRGWTASLAATQDNRVVALIPQVADFMNMKEMIDHFFSVYPEGNPAIAPYLPLRAKFDKPEMDQLTSIIDPYQYKQFLSLPKFMVTASGDHFMPPDTSKVFFDDLPGEKWMRVLPNQGHYINRDNVSLITDLTESFYGAFIQNRTLPGVTWNQEGKSLNIKTSQRPKEAWLWQATNKSGRDFRRIESNTDLSPYIRTRVKFKSHRKGFSGNIQLPQQEHGWAASFVEMHFNNTPFADLVFTTQVFVSPDNYQPI